MKKEDLKAGYVLVFGDGRKEVLAPILYLGNDSLAMFTSVNARGCQQIVTYDPFENGVIEVWSTSDIPSQSMTTDLDFRKLLWKKEKPIKVTGDERAILANLPDDFSYIARNVDGRLFLYKEKPELNGRGFYRGDGWTEMVSITKLKFDVIKPLTCHKISDLL